MIALNKSDEVEYDVSAHSYNLSDEHEVFKSVQNALTTANIEDLVD